MAGADAPLAALIGCGRSPTPLGALRSAAVAAGPCSGPGGAAGPVSARLPRLAPEPAESGAAGRPGARPRLTGPAGAARSDPVGPVGPAGPARPGLAPYGARLSRRVCDRSMSEGESKQVPSSGSDPKPEPASSGPGMTSVSAPVTSAAPPEEEEEESEDESEILEESPCGRWQKRREEVSAGSRFPERGRGGARAGPGGRSSLLLPQSPLLLPPVPGAARPRRGPAALPGGGEELRGPSPASRLPFLGPERAAGARPGMCALPQAAVTASCGAGSGPLGERLTDLSVWERRGAVTGRLWVFSGQWVYLLPRWPGTRAGSPGSSAFKARFALWSAARMQHSQLTQPRSSACAALPALSACCVRAQGD